MLGNLPKSSGTEWRLCGVVLKTFTRCLIVIVTVTMTVTVTTAVAWYAPRLKLGKCRNFPSFKRGQMRSGPTSKTDHGSIHPQC